MKNLSIDIETYSTAPLNKGGVYRYCGDRSFEILLFGYSANSGSVQVVDFTAGEQLPAKVRSALTNPTVTNWAFNAQFESVCLSRWLGMPVGKYLNPASWRCIIVWAATLGLPLSLEGVGAVFGLEKQKLKEGKDLIRYFCTPAKDRDGNSYRHCPEDAPESGGSKHTISGMWKRKCLSSRSCPNSRSARANGSITSLTSVSTTVVSCSTVSLSPRPSVATKFRGLLRPHSIRGPLQN